MENRAASNKKQTPTTSGYYSKNHRLILCEFYSANKWPNTTDYNLLAKILGRNVRSIRDWFKYKRRRDKPKNENIMNAVEPLEEIEITVK